MASSSALAVGRCRVAPLDDETSRSTTGRKRANVSPYACGRDAPSADTTATPVPARTSASCSVSAWPTVVMPRAASIAATRSRISGESSARNTLIGSTRSVMFTKFNRVCVEMKWAGEGVSRRIGPTLSRLTHHLGIATGSCRERGERRGPARFYRSLASCCVIGLGC